MKFSNLFVSLASFGPLHFHLDPPSAPSCRKVTILTISGLPWVDLGAHFCECWRFFMCLKASGAEKEGSGRHSASETFFSAILGSAPRCSGWFSLQRELCFTLAVSGEQLLTFSQLWREFGIPKLKYTHFEAPLSPFWVAKWGVIYSELLVNFQGQPGF